MRLSVDRFLKKKLAPGDKNQAQFQQSDVKTNFWTRSGILNHCDRVDELQTANCKLQFSIFSILNLWTNQNDNKSVYILQNFFYCNYKQEKVETKNKLLTCTTKIFQPIELHKFEKCWIAPNIH